MYPAQQAVGSRGRKKERARERETRATPQLKGSGQSWILDSTVWIPDSMHWIPDLVSRTWIPDSIVSGIPDSKSCSPYSKAQDSALHKQKFRGFRIPREKFLGFQNPDSLTWGDKSVLAPGYGLLCALPFPASPPERPGELAHRLGYYHVTCIGKTNTS